MMEGTILLVGCGKMGGALLEGWFKRGLNPVDVIIVEPAGRASIRACDKHRALTVLPRVDDVPRDFIPDVVIFAVKPFVIADVVGGTRRFAGARPLYLTVIAGKPIAFYKAHLGDDAAIVRAMPNTPAAVGKAISVMVASAEVDATQRRVCDVLMSAVGEVTWIQDEALMDAVTAVSGSGPAYVFQLAEDLAAAGVAAGLPADLAERLARLTVAGAGAMLGQLPDSAAKLRENVTTPGGTTAAALEVLRAENGLKPLMSAAVAAAAKRSRDLAG
ncbi:MAG: pyrroline-5-carboxylate reductase [Rhodospirillaceae bacterium]|nr:pyrroline-5-carboxylate reductase [Rhodospirillaceae bacterium]